MTTSSSRKHAGLGQRATSLRSPSLLSQSVHVRCCIWAAWVAYQPCRENSRGSRSVR